MSANWLRFSAASVRILLAVMALFIFPYVYPPIEAHRWIFIGYGAVAIFLQFMIWKDFGGEWRVFLGGLLDMAVITFMIQRVGTARTMLVSFYFVAGVINGLVVSPRMGFLLSAVGAGMFSLAVGLEASGVLQYAPDGPVWEQGNPPTPTTAALLAILVAFLLLLCSSIVGFLVRRLNDRERQLVDANERLAELSRLDPLTQLFNRRHVLQHIEDGLAWLNRGRPMVVVMIDLDEFKRVNDERGHIEGDELLRRIADALRSSTREVDVAGRYGGDEFVVVLPDTDLEQGRIAGHRFVEAIRAVGQDFAPEAAVTASAGLSVAKVGDVAYDILKRADAHAYAAKRMGGDQLFG